MEVIQINQFRKSSYIIYILYYNYTTMSTELEYLTIDPRAYKFIREQSMQDIADGFVEVITNSIDAYRRQSSTSPMVFTVDIYINLAQRLINVVDQAIGITAEDMKRAFLQVGAYTATSGSRGYFSRGAKDVSALGDLTITGIKNGLLSQCFINNLGMGKMNIIDQPSTPEDHELYKITNNGLNFQVLLKDSVNFSPENLGRYGNLTNHFALRNIFSDTNNLIYSHISTPRGPMTLRHLYQYPVGAIKIADIVYNVPGYDGVTARFELYRSLEPIENQYDGSSDKFLKFGILVQTDTAVNGYGTLYPQIRYHPYINRFYGTITCNYINTLMAQLDTSPDSYDSVKNPYSIIDPNRVGGINMAHPFTKTLYSIPYDRLLYALDEMETLDSAENDINFNDINNIFNNLNIDDDLLNITVENKSHLLIDKIYTKIQENTNIINENQDLQLSKESIQLKYNSTSKRTIKPKLNIKFLNTPLKYDYVTFKTLDGYTINISIPSSELNNIVTIDATGKYIGLNTEKARIHIMYLIREALSRLLVQKYFLNTESFSNTVNPDLIFMQYEQYNNKLQGELSKFLTNTVSAITGDEARSRKTG